MNIAPEPWLAAYITVGVSLVIGLWFGLRLPRPTAPLYSAGDDTVRDLETRYEQYIAQLRDVDQQQHRLTPGAFDTERAEYEALAQAALHKLNEAKQSAERRARLPQGAKHTQMHQAAQSSIGFWRRHPQLQGGLWGAGAMGIAFFLYTTAQQDGHPEPQPQATSTAGPGPVMPPGAAPQAGQGVDAEEMKALAQGIKDNPDDVVALLKFAHLLLRAQMLDEARTINDRALRLRPNDLEALTHAAVLSASSGDVASSDIGLDMVLKKDPTFIEAWFFRGMLAMQRGDQARVEASFAAYLQHAPPGAQRDRIEGMLARMKGSGG